MLSSRKDLAKHFNELRFKSGAEIGVSVGEFAAVLCETIPDLKYYGIDLWPKREHLAEAKKRLKPYNASFVRATSLEAAKRFKDNSLDFVYIDADHRFDFVVQDIISWTKKVRKGGIVAGHDYHASGTCGVKPAVDGYLQSHSLSLNLTTDTSEGISWWFVKKWNI
ncbi:class I SAM-dependent methyltransferase [Candidatus Microgenomates bacterium]|nr:MAG: class I SAM-dependent methyltransferase [Candidatus Microgenomates bacterium]